jgi:hypothetical protein
MCRETLHCRRIAWTCPAWYAYPAGRLRFLVELRACDVSASQTRIDRADRRHRGGFQAEFDLNIAGLPARHVRVVFASLGTAPSVYCDGPTDSPTGTGTDHCACGIRGTMKPHAGFAGMVQALSSGTSQHICSAKSGGG